MINKKQIKKTASLAKIEISDDELKNMPDAPPLAILPMRTGNRKKWAVVRTTPSGQFRLRNPPLLKEPPLVPAGKFCNIIP